MKERKFSPTLKNRSHNKIPEPRCKLCGRWFIRLMKSHMCICSECRKTKKGIIPHAIGRHKPYSELTFEQKKKISVSTSKWQTKKLKTDPEWKHYTYIRNRRLTDDTFRKKMNLYSLNYIKRRCQNDLIFAEKYKKKCRERLRIRWARKKALLCLRYLYNNPSNISPVEMIS